jgi:hypothetical protein
MPAVAVVAVVVSEEAAVAGAAGVAAEVSEEAGAAEVVAAEAEAADDPAVGNLDPRSGLAAPLRSV